MTDRPSPPMSLPGLSRELRRVAKVVLDIGYGPKTTPESTLLQKQQAAARLEQLAGLIDVGLARGDGGAN